MTRIWNIITGSNGGRPPCDVRIDERRVEFRPERPEIHRDPKGLELVAEVAYPLPPIIDIKKKTRLAAQRIISPPPTPMESEMLKLGQVLRTLQVTKMTTMKAISRDESAVPAMVSTMAKGPQAG